MNLLALIQQVCRELAISVPTAVVTSVDPMIVQLYALLNRHGHDMSRQFEWEKLDREYMLTTVAFANTCTLTVNSAVVTMASTTGITTNFAVVGTGVNQYAQVLSVDSPTQITMNMPATVGGSQRITFAQIAYPLPSDWLHQIPRTEWDRTNRWALMGPKSPQAWQAYKSGIVYAGARERFRILGGLFQVTPPPANGIVFSYEYISSAWVIDTPTGTYKQNLSADTDTWVFDDSLLVSALKMRWKQAKGLDWSFEGQEYNALLQGLKAQDKSAPTLSLTMGGRSIYNMGDEVIAGTIGGDWMTTEYGDGIVIE